MHRQRGWLVAGCSAWLPYTGGGGGGGRWFEQVVTGGGSYVGFDS